MTTAPTDRDHLTGTEAGSEVAPRTDGSVPKGMKPMQNYRLSSSAHTGRAPRSMRDAFGCDQNDRVYPMPDRNESLLAPLGRFANALGRFIARLFGR